MGNGNTKNDSHSVSWEKQAVDEFRSLVRKGFPCVFGIKASLEDTIRFAFCDSSSELSGEAFVKAVGEYVEFCKMTPPGERLLKPLVVLVKTTKSTLSGYHELAWALIQHLHDSDDISTWPQSIPKDPFHSNWTFCFKGFQLFFNISTPLHTLWKSRNLGSNLAFVINPRENFDLVAPNSSASGKRMREIIRERIKRFNNVDSHPKELGFFGDPHNFEWKQFQLSEPGALDITACPFQQRGKNDD